MRQEQSLADLAIGQTFGSELCDLELLGGELIAGIESARAERLARGAQFLPRAIAPASGAQDVEELDRFAQGCAGLDAAPLPAQPTAESEQRPRARVRMGGAILAKRGLEQGVRVLFGGQQRSRAGQ